GMPGLAKTLAVKTLAQAVDASFSRIQFTPDLLPADIVGTLIYHPDRHEFEPKQGPIFAQIVLADEVNRAPAKVQSALLEAMQEHQVTLGEQTLAMPEPFLVLATQNPLEQEGTYPLPEAQVDRFMLKLVVTYPSREEERLILDRMGRTEPLAGVKPVVTPEQILAARAQVDAVYLDEKIKDYVISLVWATRTPTDYGLKLDHLIEYGASPRATIALTLAAKAWAVIAGRDYVTPQDVKTLAPDVLRHRVGVTYEAEAEALDSGHLIERILAKVPVP
ncbi:MAG: AAA family ATPase, partial [Opitutales bacterium]